MSPPAAQGTTKDELKRFSGDDPHCKSNPTLPRASEVIHATLTDISMAGERETTPPAQITRQPASPSLTPEQVKQIVIVHLQLSF
jgi:hypothetical protein